METLFISLIALGLGLILLGRHEEKHLGKDAKGKAHRVIGELVFGSGFLAMGVLAFSITGLTVSSALYLVIGITNLIFAWLERGDLLLKKQ